MSEFSDATFPWTLYFNGVAMPKWANCWNQAGLARFAEPSMSDWDGRIRFRDLDLLDWRMDKAGLLESEDPIRFTVLSLELLRVVLTKEAEIRKELRKFALHYKQEKEEGILAGIRDGLLRMVELVMRDRMALWITGFEAERLVIDDWIRRYRLSLPAIPVLAWPHDLDARREGLHRLRAQRKEIVALAEGRGLSKETRAWIQRWSKDVRLWIQAWRGC